MEIEDSPLYLEFLDVLTKCDKNSQLYYRALIHLDLNGTTYDPLQVITVDLRRDYMNGFADEMSCTFDIPLGKYAKKIYPNRNHLQITLMRVPLLENTDVWDEEKPIESQRFMALLIEDKKAVAELEGTETKDEWSLDLQDILKVKFQLFTKANEKIMTATIGGTYRKTKLSELLLTAITTITNEVKTGDKFNIKGVDLIPPDNSNIIEQVIVKHGLRLVDFPGFLQKKHGVYNSGLGSYIQGNNWYIFSMYDTGRFNDAKKTLTVYVLPKKKFPEVERTYRVLGDSLVIVTTTETDFRGDNDIQFITQGSGVRFTEASKVMEDFGTTSGNKTIVSRKKNNNEFMFIGREDGINFAPVTKDRVTSNPFQHYTDLAARRGGLFKMNWENSNPNLIFPGMVVRVIYLDHEVMKEAYGIVLAGIHRVVKVGEMNTIKHSSNSQLYVFTNLKDFTE
jgi:hypothetical protein